MNGRLAIPAMAAAGGVLAGMWLDALVLRSQSAIRVEAAPILERLLTGFIGSAEAADAVGSCPIASALPDRQPFMVAANANAVSGQVPGAESSQGTVTSAAGGGCSISQPAPGGGMSVAGAGASAEERAMGTGEVEKPVDASLSAPVAAQQIGDLTDEPVAEVAVAKPVSATAPVRRARPRAVPTSAKKAWWPARVSGELNLIYAGEAAFTGAIALLFDGAFETTDIANRNIEVRDQNGRAVKGTWLVSTNRQMLLFGAAPGLYSVSLGTGLADKGGRTLSASSEGHVFVR